MSNNPAHVIAEAVVEAQAILHDHLQFGVGSSADVLAQVNRILSERTLIRALYDAGSLPSNNPPDAVFTIADQGITSGPESGTSRTVTAIR